MMKKKKPSDKLSSKLCLIFSTTYRACWMLNNRPLTSRCLRLLRKMYASAYKLHRGILEDTRRCKAKRRVVKYQEVFAFIINQHYHTYNFEPETHTIISDSLELLQGLSTSLFCQHRGPAGQWPPQARSVLQRHESLAIPLFASCTAGQPHSRCSTMSSQSAHRTNPFPS